MKRLAIALALMLAAGPGSARDKDAPARPPTRMTQTLGAKVYKQLEQGQAAYEAKDYAGALAVLDALRAEQDTLNDYEVATLWNFYAAVYYAQDDVPKAIEAYGKVLAQPNLAEGLRNNTLFALAQLHFVSEDYATAIEVLQRWFAVVQDVQPDAHMLLAQAHYQLQRYDAAEKATLAALRTARERQVQPKENWLALLRAIYYELEQYERAAKVLELLVAWYPKEAYWLQLSGMYGLLERPADQLAALRTAYAAGMLRREGDLVNLARLCLLQEAPYPAVEVMKAGLAAGHIGKTPENLQLYAQALAAAHEYEAQIPVLQELAQASGEARHHVYLGQAQMALGDWSAAADAFRAATKGKSLERPGEAQLLLGTALYNQKKFREAREVFMSAQHYEDAREQARQWVEFMTSEIARRQVVAAAQ